MAAAMSRMVFTACPPALPEIGGMPMQLVKFLARSFLPHLENFPAQDLYCFVLGVTKNRHLLGSTSNRRMVAPYCRRKTSLRVVLVMFFAGQNPLHHANLSCLPQEGADHGQPEPDSGDELCRLQAHQRAEWSPLL